MASNQSAKTSKSPQASAARKAPQSRPAPRTEARSTTGERDESYAVISVLYHALQGADTLDQYIQDAREAEDDELVEFFEATKTVYAERAAEAKQLLATRLEAAGEEEDDEEDEEEDDEEED